MQQIAALENTIYLRLVKSDFPSHSTGPTRADFNKILDAIVFATRSLYPPEVACVKSSFFVRRSPIKTLYNEFSRWFYAGILDHLPFRSSLGKGRQAFE